MIKKRRENKENIPAKRTRRNPSITIIKGFMQKKEFKKTKVATI
jgi:hypothetical protein